MIKYLNLIFTLIFISFSAFGAPGQKVTGELVVNGNLNVSSTTKSSKPCPVMTEAQILAVSSPANGSCVYNSDKKAPYYYSTTDSTWKLAGGVGSDNNLLVNGSFEDGTTGWLTSSTGTATPNLAATTTTTKEFGEKKGVFSCAGGASGGTCTLYSDVTTSQKVQGLVSAWIAPSNPSATQFYSRVNGANNLSRSPIVSTLDYFEVPQVIGSSSFGIGFVITVPASVTYTLDVDDAFIGAENIRSSSSVTSRWQAYTPVFTGFGTVTGIEMQWRQNGQNIELRGKFTSGTSTATEARMSLPSVFTSAGTSIIPSIQVAGTGAYAANGATIAPYILIEPNVSYVTFGYSQATTAGLNKVQGSSFIGSGGTFSLIASVPVSGLQATTDVYSVGNYANSGWVDCGLTPSDFTNYGTVSGISIQCKKDGEDLIMRGSFTISSPAAAEARMALKYNGSYLTSKNTPTISALEIIGSYWLTATTPNKGGNIFIEPNVGYVTFGDRGTISSSSVDPDFKANGSDACSGTCKFGQIRIPIATWNENSLTASLANTPTTQGSSNSDVQTVYFGGSAGCNSNCTTGNCTVCLQVGGKITSVSYNGTTGQYRLNGIDGTKYSCGGTGLNVGTGGATINGLMYLGTSSYAVISAVTAGTGVNVGNSFVTCIGLP